MQLLWHFRLFGGPASVPAVCSPGGSGVRTQALARHPAEGTVSTVLVRWVTKHYKPRGFSHRSSLSHSSGGKKSKIKVAAGLALSERCEGESIPCLFLLAGGLLAVFGVPGL